MSAIQRAVGTGRLSRCTVRSFDSVLEAATDAEGTTLTYAWSFGDGGTASTANATHAYPAAGAYLVTLLL